MASFRQRYFALDLLVVVVFWFYGLALFLRIC